MSYPVFTSESVCAGHPDKICDQISDAIVDAAISQDPFARVAVETLVTINQVVLAGEIRSTAQLNFPVIAAGVIKRLGYTQAWSEFDNHSPISVFIHQQSPDIAQGVDTGGAGDQGIMYGYACIDTDQFMPLPIFLAHQLTLGLDKLRETKQLPYLRPDGKAEVTVRYSSQGNPISVETIVLAVPHESHIELEDLKKDLSYHLVQPLLSKLGYRFNPKQFIVNGTGKWEIGGPASDTGVTGRKIIVDTYGGMARHGGGCFSGKDATKVDRSGAYACRYLAKNIVAAGLADKVEVKVAYAIGYAQPIAKAVDTFGTEKVSLKKIQRYMDSLLDLSVPSILNGLNLHQPIFERTAAYGHFGRDGFSWEKIKEL